MTRYLYDIAGTGANGQTWRTTGTVEPVADSRTPVFTAALLLAQVQSFHQLTNGKAEYGQPGVGCNGPYTIVTFLVTREL